MSKRAFEQEEVEEQVQLPLLPDDILSLITRQLWVRSNERAMAETLVHFALCNKAWYTELHFYVTRCTIQDWCVLCGANTGDTDIGCLFNSSCALQESTQSDLAEAKLCDACCQHYCDLCQRGSCGCHLDASYCYRCKKSICEHCLGNEDLVESARQPYTERDLHYCLDCFVGLTPVSTSAESDDEEQQ